MPLSHLHPPAAADLGAIGGVERVTIGGRWYTHLLPPPPGATTPLLRVPTAQALPVTTAVLCAPNRTASEELQAAAACALGSLGAALRQRRPRLVPGAGCLELLLAMHLRREAAALMSADLPNAALVSAAAGDGRSSTVADAACTSRRLQQAVCELLADVLESTVVALAGGGLAGREALDALAVANEDAAAQATSAVAAEGAAHERVEVSFFGWDTDAEQPMEVLRTSCCPQRSPRRRTHGREAHAVEDSATSSDDGSSDDDSTASHTSLRVESVGVAELASEKVEAMFSAIEVACALIGVDAVIADTR